MKVDYCIVGGGIAGLYSLRKISTMYPNAKLCLIELGYRNKPEELRLDTFEIEKGSVYRYLQEGQRKGIGGSSSAWGGSLITPSRLDTEIGDRHDEAWKRVQDIVMREIASVLREIIKIGSAKKLAKVIESLEEIDICFTKRINIFLNPNERSFARQLDPYSISNCRVIEGAIIADLTTDKETQKLINLDVISGENTDKSRYERVFAERFVFCTGALSNLKYLHAIGYKNGNVASTVNVPLCDHVSVKLASIPRHGAGNIIKKYMHNVINWHVVGRRFIEKESPYRGFFHFEHDRSGGELDILRSIVSDIQRNGLSRKLLMRLLGQYKRIGTLFKALFIEDYIDLGNSKFLDLLYDVDTCFMNNYITLKTDGCLNSKAMSKVKFLLPDTSVLFLEYIINKAELLLEALGIQDYRIYKSEELQFKDVFHPCSVTSRIAGSSLGVDLESLKFLHAENVFAPSTGVLPSAGTANPTLTLLCLINNSEFK